MLDSTYLGWQGMCDGGSTPNESIWWRVIKKVCGGQVDLWFEDMVEWKIREGSHTRFWKDRWCGRERLQHKFTKLFFNSEQKEDSVEKMGSLRDDKWVWEYRWRRE